jgi:hypothetical protein
MTEPSVKALYVTNEIALLLDRIEAEGHDMRAVGFELMRYGVSLLEDHGTPADERLTGALCKLLLQRERH